MVYLHLIVIRCAGRYSELHRISICIAIVLLLSTVTGRAENVESTEHDIRKTKIRHYAEAMIVLAALDMTTTNSLNLLANTININYSFGTVEATEIASFVSSLIRHELKEENVLKLDIKASMHSEEFQQELLVMIPSDSDLSSWKDKNYPELTPYKMYFSPVIIEKSPLLSNKVDVILFVSITTETQLWELNITEDISGRIGCSYRQFVRGQLESQGVDVIRKLEIAKESTVLNH